MKGNSLNCWRSQEGCVSSSHDDWLIAVCHSNPGDTLCPMTIASAEPDELCPAANSMTNCIAKSNSMAFAWTSGSFFEVPRRYLSVKG